MSDNTEEMQKAYRSEDAFNEAMDTLESLEFSIGDAFSGHEKRIITVTGDDVMMTEMFDPWDEGSTRKMPFGKEELAGILKKLKLYEWDTDYYDRDILDGIQWSLEIRSGGGQGSAEIYGSNKYPDNFDLLLLILGMIHRIHG